MVISVIAVAVLISGRRIFSIIPWALIVLVLATLIAVLTDLEKEGVSVLGPVETGPPELSWPVLAGGEPGSRWFTRRWP